MLGGNTKKQLDKIAEDFKLRLVRGSRLDKTNATSEFTSGFDVKVDNESIELKNTAKHAKAVVEGASPAKSDRDWRGKQRRIERWVRAKGIRPYRKLKGGFKFAKTNTERRSAYKSMVYILSKSISQKGTIKRFGYKGSNLINRVYNDMEKKIGVELTEAVRKDLINEINRIIKVKQ